MLVTIGDRVSEGTYRVHSRFHRVVNFRRRSHLVSVVHPTVGAGPVNIVADGMDFEAACNLRVERAGIVLDKVRFARDGGKVYRSQIELAGADMATLRRNLPAMKEILLERSSPRSLAFLLDSSRLESLRPGFERALAEHLAEGVRRVFRGDIVRGHRRPQRPDCRRGWNPDATETLRCHGSGNATVAYGISDGVGGVKMIAGCGFGLTPSGDDFLCGMLVGLHVAARVCGTDFSRSIETVYRTAETENFLSKNFLSLACEGSVDARLKALVRALLLGDRAMTRQCAGSAISVGETSGADMLTGLYMTLEKYA